MCVCVSAMKDIDTTGSTESGPSRRRVLNTLGAGAAAVVGLGSFAGSAAAWERNDVEFKGCSEVWIIVAKEDVLYKPPTVAKVIVETSHGDLDCRTVEFTPETTTTIPGRYGDAPVLKYPAATGEKVLGVIIYNYTDDEDRFSRRSPLRVNPNRCANTPGTPDPTDADCADNTFLKPEDILDGNQGSNGKKKDHEGDSTEGDSKQKGNNKKGNSGKSGKGKANGHNSE